MATGKEIKAVYNAMLQICQETSRLIQITKEIFNSKNYREHGNGVMWDKSSVYSNYHLWMPYFQQMVFSNEQLRHKAVGINIIFDDHGLNNTIPFISCGYMESTKAIYQNNTFYSAGWDKNYDSKYVDPFYETLYNNESIHKVVNYFIPLDMITCKKDIEDYIIYPLIELNKDNQAKARELINGKALRIEELTW